jgi:primase-polymerase (primpol)-like protein
MPDLSNIPFFDQAILVMLGVAATAISGSMMAYFRSRSQCFETWKKMIDKLDKRTFRIQKALILKAQLTDEQIKHDHPSEFHEYEKVIKEMLEDEEQNL